MKIRSLLLGSVAAAGLTTGALAADPATEIFTALDLCDALGLTGIVVSSDTNCLQISGEVKYEFSWGDYAGSQVIVSTAGGYGDFTIIDNNGVAGTEMDWASRVDMKLKVVGTADTDVGPAKGVITIKQIDQWVTTNEGIPVAGGDHTGGTVVIDEAYVAIGGSTILSAGKKGSIMNKGDDEPFTIVKLFLSEKVDNGVNWTKDLIPDGGHVIQIVSDLGNGLSIGAGLENLQGSNVAGKAGTGVLVASYAGEGLTAHVTFAAGGILDGTIENFGVHAGFTGTFENFRIRGAFAADNTSYWNALGTAEATFDIFKIAIAGEAATTAGGTDFGWGGSISATVVEGVTLNLAGRYYSDADGPDGYHIMGQIIAAITETLKLTGEVGYYANNAVVPVSDVYGKVILDWTPGGGFTSSITGEVHQNGGYKATFKAGKVIE
jgi:hypothetical protein